MLRRAALGFAAAVVATLAGAASAPAAEEPPNVVVVMTDDQDFRSMWAMPATRKLVKRQGTTFDTNVVNFPLCCPSRATYYSGEYAHNHGVRWNNYPDGGYYTFNGSETLPVWMSRAGYETIHIGKYLNEYGERDPYEVPRGWDQWWGGVDPTTYGYYDFTLNHNGKLRHFGTEPSDYSTDVYAEIAVREIRRAAQRNTPFFLNIAPNAPHTVAVASSARREGTPALPAPRDAGVFADAELPRYPNFNELDISDKPAVEAYFPNQLSDKEIGELTAHYRGRMGALLAVDDLVARVKGELREQGIARDTVFVFTSDNGWILGEHRLRDPVTETGEASGVKYVPYEGSSRVPLMIAGPGFPKGRTVRAPTTNADLASTILEIGGGRARLPQDGISLRRIARRPKDFQNRALLIETFENPRHVPPYASIRTRRYRYDVNDLGQANMFDLKRDPWELQSIQDDPRYATIAARLRAKLEQLRTCSGATCRKARVVTPPPLGPPLVPR